jgi:hypothetical protein
MRMTDTANDAPYSWKTFQGEIVTLDTVDQQHLSNCFWFLKVFWNIDSFKIRAKVTERFNGEILPYRPHPDFKGEKELLVHERLVGDPSWRVNEDGHLVRILPIIFKGEQIGEIAE